MYDFSNFPTKFFVIILFAITYIILSILLFQRIRRQKITHENKIDMLPKASLGILKDAICYNQGKLAEFTYIASQHHKKIKELMLLEKDKIDKEQLANYYNELNDYLNTELNNIYTENFKHIIKYFKGRSKFNVRVCVKVFYNDKIVTLFRDRTLFPNKDYPVDANTAFEHIYQTGNFYLCNDIPKSFANKQYKNARLDADKVILYSPPWSSTIMSQLTDSTDREWVKCWKKNDDGSPIDLSPEACYKSTLVIPMTLINNTLASEFKEHFDIDDKASPKTIYGFLCLDNHVVNYFHRGQQDESVGYIFADIMSLFIIQLLNYTRFSASYNTAQKILQAR